MPRHQQKNKICNSQEMSSVENRNPTMAGTEYSKTAEALKRVLMHMTEVFKKFIKQIVEEND